MPIDHSSIKKILIINLAFIGDVLLSTPVARALRQAYPGAVIDMLVVPLAAPIARGNPYINNVIEYDKHGRHKKIAGLFGLIRQLRSERYDLAVATNFAARGSIIAWISGIRYRVGYDAQHAAHFLTHPASSERPVVRHEAENYLDVLKPLGINTGDSRLDLKIEPHDMELIRQKVKRDWEKPFVLICPVGRFPQKSWTISGYASIIQALSPEYECFLVGSRADSAQLNEINKAAGDLAGVLDGILSLNELAALIAEAKLFITVDTGPMHIADAVGTPIVALFGPTDPRVWGPRGPNAIVLQHPVDCSPCQMRTACRHHRCMTDLSKDLVLSNVLKLLAKSRTPMASEGE